MKDSKPIEAEVVNPSGAVDVVRPAPEVGDMLRAIKVVCVDDNWSKSWDDPRKWFQALPEKGRVYVVQEVKRAKNGEWMLVLVGCWPISPAGFYPWRFRLLTQNKHTHPKQT